MDELQEDNSPCTARQPAMLCVVKQSVSLLADSNKITLCGGFRV